MVSAGEHSGEDAADHEFVPCTEHASCRGCASCNLHESFHDRGHSGREET